MITKSKYYIFLKPGSCIVALAGWNLLCLSDCLGIHQDLPVSATRVMESKTYGTTPSLKFALVVPTFFLLSFLFLRSQMI